MTIALVGCGFIGNALKVWIQRHNPNTKILISDPEKEYFDDVYSGVVKVDAFFIQIHVETLQDGKQDIRTLKEIIQKIPSGIPIWVRTTITISTLEELRKLNPLVEFLPEFLTQRTSIEDFEKQRMIFTGEISTLEKIFIGKSYIRMTSQEAILAKYAHNCFGAMKVTYFNCINDLCERRGVSYSQVLRGILCSGYINITHTQVPGPDGKFGYGGKCFPKDIEALKDECKDDKLFQLLDATSKLNLEFRK